MKKILFALLLVCSVFLPVSGFTQTPIPELVNWVSVTTGWDLIPTPTIKEIPAEKARTAGNVPLRGYYNPLEKVIYFRMEEGKEADLETKATLVHEIVHAYQDRQGKLFVETFKTEFDCKKFHSAEVEAYRIEDIYRSQNGLLPANMLTQEMANYACLVQVGYIVFPFYK
jgi:hypothetical protein